jgi:hypothetical protein
MTSPQGIWIVPTVIKHESIHGDVVRLNKPVPPEADRFHTIRLIQRKRFPRDVIPRVVVQKRTIGMGTLAFDIVKESPPKLTRR